MSILALARVPVTARTDADTWHHALRETCGSADGDVKITAALRTLAKRMGVSYVTARRKYDLWRKANRDRFALVNKTKLGRKADAAVTNSEPFRDWYLALAEKNQRKTAPAYREFCRRWASGEEIPGLDNQLPRHTLPPGCSYANLQRLVDDKFALAAMRRGLGFAIAKHGPKIFSTRVGLLPGQFYMFDDLHHDNFVVFKGAPVRVLELDALDVASGCKFAWGTKPRTLRADGTMDSLTEKFMRMLLASTLYHHGYHPDGCTLIAEHGTAAIRDRIEQILADRCGQRPDGTPIIAVQRSGITGAQQAVLGLGHGQGKGNPRFKAPLESLRNLMHNELAALPGQTGLDRDTRPEYTHGILTETSDLLKAVAVLARTRPQVADLIKLPLLQYHAHFLPFLAAVYDRINRRTWHKLQGWTEAGHIAIEYRLSPDTDQWLSQTQFLALPRQTQQLLLSAIGATPSFDVQCSTLDVGRSPLIRERPLSPWEVWTAGRAQLTRIPGFVAAEILGQDFATERECRNGYFEFQDQELAPEVLRYESRITDPESSGSPLHAPCSELPSDKYLIFINPFDLSTIFVHDAKGCYLGAAARVTRITRGDRDAAESAFHHRSKRLAEILQTVRSRHLGTTLEAADRAAHNRDVLADALETPAQKLTLAERRAAAAAANDILDSGSEISNLESEIAPVATPDTDFLDSISNP